MRKYEVEIGVIGTIIFDVEAENEGEAIKIANDRYENDEKPDYQALVRNGIAHCFVPRTREESEKENEEFLKRMGLK